MDLAGKGDQGAVDDHGHVSHVFDAVQPRSDVGDSLAERALADVAELESVAANLDEVVQQGAQSGGGEGGGEEYDVSELDHHFKVVGERSVIL